MQALPVVEQCDELPSPATSPARIAAARSETLRHDALWRASELGSAVHAVLSSGFTALDAELPGGGWPCHALTELLQAQPGVLEWRLLGPTVKATVAAGRSIVVVGPPRTPHLPGLQHMGIDERHLCWIQADTPAERLWCTEQLVRSNASGVLIAWLPQARPEQIRRLQVSAAACESPVFLCRPLSAQHEASAAPLRVSATFGADWELEVHFLKRRGPALDGAVRLRSIPGGLSAVLTPRLSKPSRLLPSPEVTADAVGSPAPAAPARHAALH